MQHRLILDCRTGAEREQIGYPVGKRGARGSDAATQPKGVVVLPEGGTADMFREDVYVQIEEGANHPKTCTPGKSTPAVTPQVKRLPFSTGRSADIVKNRIKYLPAEQRAVFDDSDTAGMGHSARTRKGNMRITVNVEGEKDARCTIGREGYGGGVDFFAGCPVEDVNVLSKVYDHDTGRRPGLREKTAGGWMSRMRMTWKTGMIRRVATLPGILTWARTMVPDTVGPDATGLSPAHFRSYPSPVSGEENRTDL